MGKIVQEHNQYETFQEVIHYGDHEKRTESKEFIKVKRQLHQDHVPCWINNGHCEGGLEIHHNIIEYSASSEVDWNKIHKDYPDFKDVDSGFQMQVLCRKHHRDPGFGKHKISYPAWILQKYLKEDVLIKFEEAVQEMVSKGHNEHEINHHAAQHLLSGVRKVETV